MKFKVLFVNYQSRPSNQRSWCQYTIKATESVIKSQLNQTAATTRKKNHKNTTLLRNSNPVFPITTCAMHGDFHAWLCQKWTRVFVWKEKIYLCHLGLSKFSLIISVQSQNLTFINSFVTVDSATSSKRLKLKKLLRAIQESRSHKQQRKKQMSLNSENNVKNTDITNLRTQLL